MVKALVLGSLVLDFICEVLAEVGNKFYLALKEICGGGGGRNVAIAATRLGLKVWLLGAVGRDQWGDELIAELHFHEVNTDFVQVEPERITGFSLIILERYALSVRGANEALSLPNALDLGQFDWLYAASIPVHTQAELLSALRTSSRQPLLYLNPGSSQIKDRERLLQLLRYAKVLQMNFQEAKKLVGEGDPIELACCLRSFGPEIVVITAGAKGAYAMTSREKLHQPPLHADVVDPTGAGDAFGAGVLAGLVKGLSLEDALRIGAANAAAVAEHLGVQGFLRWEEALERAGLAKPVRG